MKKYLIGLFLTISTIGLALSPIEQITLINLKFDINKQIEKLEKDPADIKQSDIDKFREMTPFLKKYYKSFFNEMKEKLEKIDKIELN